MSKVQARKQLLASKKEAKGNLQKAAPLNRIGSFNGNFRQIKRKVKGIVQITIKLNRWKPTLHNGIEFGLSTPKHHLNAGQRW